MYLSPQFGQAPKGSYLSKILKSGNYADGEFQNLILTEMDMNFSKGMNTMYHFIFEGGQRTPGAILPTFFENGILGQAEKTQVTWYGHSAILLEIDSKVILIDPMLGNYASPLPMMTKRFEYLKPIDVSNLTSIDAVILSHDHYDHLDYPTIKKIKDKVKHFYTALGVGSHLRYWGIDEDKITELDWWEDADYMDLKIIAAPARHFSGRGLTDRNKTQWASWIIQGKNDNIYFSGDSGYGPHFKEIGEKYGPFDFAMMECGQYNERWEAIHMMPEQTVQAGIDVQAERVMPIHWSAFNLSLHSWDEPVERAVKAAEGLPVNMIVPKIGRSFSIEEKPALDYWWREVK